MDLKYDIIYDEIYYGKPVQDMADRGAYRTASNYCQAELEKVSDACTHIDK